MKPVSSWDEAVGELANIGENERLTLLIEDWEKGLRQVSGSAKDVLNELADLKARYGEYCSWRAFGPGVDVWWCREGGVAVAAPGAEDQAGTTLFMETDWRRFPGVGAIGRSGRKVRLRAVPITAPARHLRLVGVWDGDNT
jgi:hypothetical protein